MGGLGEAQNLVRKVPSSLVEERKDACLSNLPPAIVPLGCDTESALGDFNVLTVKGLLRHTDTF